MYIADTRKIKDSLAEYNKKYEKTKLLMTAVGQQTAQVIRSVEMEEEKKKAAEEFPEDNEEAILFTVALKRIILPLMPFEDQEENAEVAARYLQNAHVFTEKEIQENPFIRDIHLEFLKEKPIKIGEFEFTTERIRKYGLFLMDEPEEAEKLYYIPKLGMCDFLYRYPSIRCENKRWDAVDARTIQTESETIDRAHGNVLVFGLGLGYFPYMAARKSEVEHVTVVEKTPEIVEFFEEYVLPQFGAAKEKITIVQEEDNAYIDEMTDGAFDFCMVDNYRDRSVVYTYIKMQSKLSKFQNMETFYREEESILGQIKMNVVELMNLALKNYEFLGDNIPYRSGFRGEKYRLLSEEILKDVKIESVKDVDEILEDETLEALIDQANVLA
ncbi:MAG: hypothetical protein ACI4HI_16180 [Lachnospiraceae bacterium]